MTRFITNAKPFRWVIAALKKLIAQPKAV